jgi:hypothetical protein
MGYIKPLLLSTSFILIHIIGSAQDSLKLMDHRFTVRFNVGYVNSKLYGSYVDRLLNANLQSFPMAQKNAGGIETSFLVTAKLFKFASLKSGIGFTQQGGEITHSPFVYPIDVKLNYLTIPLGVGFNTTMRKTNLAVEGGVQLAFEISSSQDFRKGISNFYEQKNETTIPSYFLGGSLVHDINGAWGIEFSYRFVNAMKPFYTQEYLGQVRDMSTRAQSFSVGVIYGL